jgi:hypothetical protein
MGCPRGTIRPQPRVISQHAAEVAVHPIHAWVPHRSGTCGPCTTAARACARFRGSRDSCRAAVTAAVTLRTSARARSRGRSARCCAGKASMPRCWAQAAGAGRPGRSAAAQTRADARSGTGRGPSELGARRAWDSGMPERITITGSAHSGCPRSTSRGSRPTGACAHLSWTCGTSATSAISAGMSGHRLPRSCATRSAPS